MIWRISSMVRHWRSAGPRMEYQFRNSTDERRRTDLHMNLLSLRHPQHLDNEMAGGTADNGVINHDDAFSATASLNSFSLTFTADTVALFRLDEGTSQ